MPREIETKELIKFPIVDYNDRVESKADHWYIKQGDRTLGPVDRAYVEKCLLNGGLQFTDYVSEGGKPWKMIRDVAVLEPVLREVEVRGPPAPAEVPSVSKAARTGGSFPFVPNSAPLDSATGSVSQAKSNLELEIPGATLAAEEKTSEIAHDKASEKGTEKVVEKVPGPASVPGSPQGDASDPDKLELDHEHGRRPRVLQPGEVRLAPTLVNRKPSRKARRRRRKIKKVLRFVGALIVFALGFFITKYFNEK